MQLLYISSLSSERLISEIYSKTGANPGFAVQKFSRLLVKGILHNNINIATLSIAPLTKDYTKRIFVNLKEEVENDVDYKYIPYINLALLKHICVFLYTFFYVLIWGLKDRKDKTIICDVLCISSSMGSLLASKVCGLKSVAVITDIYEQIVGERAGGFKALLKSMAGFLNKRYTRMFDSYVLLTEDMNEVVNPRNRPYIVMEALCDVKLAQEKIPEISKDNPKVIMYAGGLEEKYGLKMLVDAFTVVPGNDIELHLYGSGSYVNDLIEVTKKDNRIKYLGVKSNEEIVKAEIRATLLVNPRFSTEEFTRYSFPSKNMEYMVSGTPLLTTKLPGMPQEYYPNVFLAEEESIDGFATAISNLLDQSSEFLCERGFKAREFVLSHKNNVKQAERILALINLS